MADNSDEDICDYLELYEKWMSTGEKMKLEGEKLLNFVESKVQSSQERRDRLEKRREEKAQREHELKVKAMEIEEREKESEKKYNLEMEKLKLSASATPSSSGTSPGVPKSQPPKGPKLLAFDESTDDMDAYLRRFERYAKANNWAQENYAMYLSSLLKGKALDVYSRMPISDVDDYSKLKDALLKRFQLTEEGFRKKFHDVKMNNDESASQYMARLADYFDRWIQLAKVKDKFVDLRQFIIVEQFIHSCPNEVGVYLRERGIRTMDEATRVAESYMEAHKVQHRPKSEKKNNQEDCINQSEKDLPNNEQITKPFLKNIETKKKFQSVKEKKCWLCNETGHIASNCPAKQRAIAAVQLADCDSNDSDDPDDPALISTIMMISDVHKCMPGLKHKRICERIPTIGSAELLHEDKKLSKNLPTFKGTMNNKTVTVLRDTGCSSVVVKSSLVNVSQLTGKTLKYMTVDKTMKSVPVAEIHLQSPVFSGTLQALCIDDPICEVIIGNLPEVVSQPDDILYNFYKENQHSPNANNWKSNKKQLNDNSNLPSTKSTQDFKSQTPKTQMIKQKDSSEMHIENDVSISHLAGIGNYQDFKEEQDSDPSLFQARKREEIQKTKRLENGNSVIQKIKWTVIPCNY